MRIDGPVPQVIEDRFRPVREPAPAPSSDMAEPERQSRSAPVVPPVAGDLRSTIVRLESQRQAQDDPVAEAALRRAIAKAEAELQRRAEAEARRQEAEDAQRREQRRQAAALGSVSVDPQLPEESQRPLLSADRLRRAAVEGAYLAGDLGPGGLGIDVLAR